MITRFISRAALATLPLAAFLLASPAAHAADPLGSGANLVFSGGSGGPLSLTVTSPITYTITEASSGFFGFVFDGASTAGTASFDRNSLSGSLSFTINNGAPQALDRANSNASGPNVDITDDDIYVFSSAGNYTLSVGDVVVLNAGTATTEDNVSAPAPTSGSFNTFLIGMSATRISNTNAAAAAAPEPCSIALLLTAGVPVVGLVRRRTRK